MYKKIILPIDISDSSSWSTAFPTALALAKSFGSKLIVMTVVPDYVYGMSMLQQYFPKGWLDEVLQKAQNELAAVIKQYKVDQIEVEQIVGRGAVYQSIIDTAERVVGADLIVLSASCPGKEEYLLGPNAAKVVRHAKVSVLVVR
jgi:nucleotide-binding universal stress UspA family protein